MKPIHTLRLSPFVLVAGVFVAFGASAGDINKPVAEHRSLEGVTQVELFDTAGRVDVMGWDKSELDITGTLGGEVERLDISTSANRLTIRVVTKGMGLHLDWGKTSLLVKLPKNVALQAHLVSADIRISGIAGAQELQTVSGDIESAVLSDARIRTVSGDIHLEAAASSRLVQVSTVSGDATITGGGGELSYQSVSGDAHVKTGVLSRAFLKTVSGDLSATVGLAADGRFDAETVSGDLRVNFPGGLPAAEFDVSSLSGDLATCDGRKGAREGFGPGSRLAFRQGAATGRVHIDSKSGDVSLCGN